MGGRLAGGEPADAGLTSRGLTSGGLTSGGLILALDTATSMAVVALGRLDGGIIATTAWTAGQRHSEELLPRIARLLADAGVALGDLAGIVVGAGPGAFTGLRVGLATAKTLAHQLAIPLVGVSSGEALLRAAGAPDGVLLLPAGSADRLVLRLGSAAALLPGSHDPEAAAGQRVVAVDLPERASDQAIALGHLAQAGLAATLLSMGAARLAGGQADDPHVLVPEYVTLPRGVPQAAGEIEWSRDHL